MLPAAILAAGASSRMGAPKALLQHRDGRTFLAAACAALREAGLGPVHVVVAEPHRAQIERAARACGAATLLNPAPERGQVSSMAIALGLGAPCVLVALVDQPELDLTVLRALAAAAAREPGAVHLPLFRGQRGHPVVLPISLAAPLRDARPGESAREVIARAGLLVREHPLDAPGILLDLDTPEELARWQAAEALHAAAAAPGADRPPGSLQAVEDER